MQHPSLFLADIRNPEYLEGLPAEAQAEVAAYLEEMNSPLNKHLDIEWQETCRGYYRHLERLAMLPDAETQARYREALAADIERWLAEGTETYMVKQVRDRVFGNGIR